VKIHNATDHIHLTYFDTLLNHSIVTKSSPEGNITYINANFTKATGFTAKDVLGKNHNVLRHPNNSNKVFQKLWTTIKNGDVFRDRLLSKKKDGSDFWAETTIIPLVDDKTKEITEYICIRNDITEFLYIQREIHKQKVKEEEQKKISDAKDSFLILFSHELKTPLNAIINFSKYLLKNVGKTPIEKRKKLLKQIDLSAAKMLKDVTSILELSKIKSNKLTYNISTFNIYDALDEVMQEHEALAIEHSIETIKCYTEKTLFIKSDLHRFKQILSNIISNAIKYGTNSVHVDLNSSETEHTISVEDDGNGIKNKEKMFELFEQNEDDINTRDKKGTGIGLSFVKFLCRDLDIIYSLEDSKKLGGLNFQLKVKILC